MNTDGLLELAAGAGFTHAAALDMDSLVFRPEVREMCSADLCHSYGANWSCPPAAGSLETIRERAEKYTGGIIVQTTDTITDDFDIDGIHEIMKRHTQCFDTLVRQIRMLCPECLPMGAGACRRCRKCTYPDRPCRHPDRMYPSMEAYGLLVSDVALRSGLKYNYGKNTMTFTSCVLVNRDREVTDHDR